MGEVKRPIRVQAAFDVWRSRDDVGPNASALFEYIERLEDELQAQADGCSAIAFLLRGQSSAVAALLISMLAMQESAARAALEAAESSHGA